MWNSRSLLLYVRVFLRRKGPQEPRGPRQLNLRLWGALYVLRQCLESWDPLLDLIPRRAAGAVRPGKKALQALLGGIMSSAPQTFAQVEVEGENEKLLVEVKSIGWKGESQK